jgi:serine-type D-Ala-D-Ala endopeptidase (penicillin-binding protein 7)
MRRSISFEHKSFWFATKFLATLFVVGAGVQFSFAAVTDEFLNRAHVAAVGTTVSPPIPPDGAAPVSLDQGIPIPEVTATAFVVGDIQKGVVYASGNADHALPIASITKLMTALVAREIVSGDTKITITSDDRTRSEGTPGSLPAHASFDAKQLYYPLLEESNNAVAFAFERAQSEHFIPAMNARARELGMTEAFFEEPTGLSPRNVASARDIFMLSKHMYDVQRDLLNITREREQVIVATNGRKYTVPNYNVFSKDEQFVGGKTGFTDEASQTMTALFEVPVGNATTTLAIVVLGSEDRKKDIERLVGWFKESVR